MTESIPKQMKRLAMKLIALANEHPEETAAVAIGRNLQATVRRTISEYFPDEFCWEQIMNLLGGQYPTQQKKIKQQLGARLANMVESGELLRDEQRKRWIVLGVHNPKKPIAEQNFQRLKRRMEWEKNQ
jgi:hypothetical protein